MINKIRAAIIAICLGLCAGLGAHYLINRENGIPATHSLTITIPENGIKTDGLGISLLQTAMKHEPGASVLVAPALTADALLLLKEQSSEIIQQDINKTGIIFPETEHSAIPLSHVVAAADYGLRYDESFDSASIIRLPFSTDRPTTIALFNGMLRNGIFDSTTSPISSNLLNADTRFVVGTASNMVPEFETPFLAVNTLATEFENANGSIPTINMMRLRANVRYVKDENGEWEAVAVRLAPTWQGKAEPTVWIGILPTASAEAMAKQLTVEQLTTIRQKLAQATPIDCCVSLPQLFWSPPARNLQPLLEELGLNRLFDSSSPNWKFTHEKIGLDAFLEKISISFIPQQGNNELQPRPENAAVSISFNRPFLWLIGDLTTAAPPYFIGLVQNL